MSRALEAEALNFKNGLNTLCQRLTGLPMTSTDLVYTVIPHGTQFQATVTLACLESQQEAAGELSATEKAAEQSAAYYAIQALENDLALLGYTSEKCPPEISPTVQQAAQEAGVMRPGQDVPIKAMLHSAVKQILGRSIEKGEVAYEFVPAEPKGMFMARLTLPGIPEPLGQHVWTSPVSPFRADCQSNAAAQALDSLLSDPLLRAHIDVTGFTETMASMDKRAAEKKAKKRKAEEVAMAAKGKCKGGGKGTGGAGKSWGAGKGGGGGMDDMMGAMMGMMMSMMAGGKGKGKN